MSCAPFTCCSIGAATDCATTSAFAPGKLVDTVTCGGTTWGYCAIGKSSADRTPTRIMTSAMTVEKTGRSMKKLSMTVYAARSEVERDSDVLAAAQLLLGRSGWRIRGSLAARRCRCDWLNRCSRLDLAGALDHDAIACVEAARNDPIVS